MSATEPVASRAEERPSIGVVIPTTGRPSVARAVASALAQTIPPDRVVVVVDGPKSCLAGIDLPHDPRVVVLEQVPARGPGAARNLGVREAGTELLGLLDDDDEWLPNKLALQMDLYERMRARGVLHPVIACRAIVQDGTGREVGRTPRYLIRQDQRVGNYLFSRRRVRPGESAVGASMILCEAGLLACEPFDVDLGRHEDWDWLLRVARRAGTQLAHVDAFLLRYTKGPASRSATGASERRLAFLSAHRTDLSAREQANFLLGVVASLALRRGDWQDLRAVLRRPLRLRSASLQAWLGLAAEVALIPGRRMAGSWHRHRAS